MQINRNEIASNGNYKQIITRCSFISTTAQRTSRQLASSWESLMTYLVSESLMIYLYVKIYGTNICNLWIWSCNRVENLYVMTFSITGVTAYRYIVNIDSLTSAFTKYHFTRDYLILCWHFFRRSWIAKSSKIIG